jgi:F-type H+-transporting ATPase subunit epsilon
VQFEVVTPKGTALTTEADEVIAPGVRGEFGVLPGHTPFLSALKPGVLQWKSKGKTGVMAVGPGYAEVNGHDKVVVLTQQAAPVEQIDIAGAQKDLDEADRQLKEWRAPEAGAAPGVTREELDAKRAWAQARLDAKKA